MADPRTQMEFTLPAEADVDAAVERACAEMGIEPAEVEVLTERERETGEVRVRLIRRNLEPEMEDQTLNVARQALQNLLVKMKIKAEVQARWGTPEEPDEEAPLLLDIRGNDLGMLIGRKGETLTALQYITRLIISKQLTQSLNLIIDVEGYRQRREQQIRRMARRMAEQAIQRRRTMVLEPMPANERRIVHLELRDHPDVHTESVGEGDRRKVTIIPK
jgi:spoIIIJ-associated protein